MKRFRVVAILILLLLGQAVAPAQGGGGVAARVERAAALIREGKAAEAEQQLNAILKVAPNEPGALNLLGAIRAQQGRLDDAEALFARAVRGDSRFAGPHMNLAYLYLLKGQPEKTIAELKEVLRLEPANADAAHKLARLLLSQNHLNEGIAFIEELRARGMMTTTLAVMLGDARLAKGDARQAEESYLQALRDERGNFAALLGLAEASRLKADAQATSLYLASAKVAAADSPELLYKYALVALKAGRSDEARAALLKALESNPANAPAVFALGVAWLKKPDVFEAEQSFRRFLSLNPASAQGQLFLGYALLKQKKYAEARQLLEQSIKQDATTPEGAYYLGVIAQEQKEDERAVGILEDVARRFPSFANAHVALGASYLRLKNYARAREELELAVKLNPDEPKAHYNLALLYARLKEPARAQEEMRLVEQLKSKSGAQTEDEDNQTPPPPTP